MSSDDLIGKGATQIAREDRAIAMRDCALSLIRSGATSPNTPEVRERTISGVTIVYELLADTKRLTVGTKAGKVLAVEWENNGSCRVLNYTPGLWETRLRYVTQRGTT